MASDDMKKMLLLIESCSCESNKEESNKEELEEVNTMPGFDRSRAIYQANRAAAGLPPETQEEREARWAARRKERQGVNKPEEPKQVDEDFDSFMESIQDMLGELKSKTYTNAGDERYRQAANLNNLELKGTGHSLHRADNPTKLKRSDFPTTGPVGKLADRAQALRDKGNIRAGQEEIDALGMSPATRRTIAIDQVKEDAEFQSFMETLKYVMKK